MPAIRTEQLHYPTIATLLLWPTLTSRESEVNFMKVAGFLGGFGSLLFRGRLPVPDFPG